MKYKKYVLTFAGDKEVVSFLKRYVNAEQERLGEARALGRAAQKLFGVRYNVASVTVPKATMEKVKSI